MTSAQALMLLRQVFASEADYLEIRNRRDALLAMTQRTPEQDAELADYQKKLQHDRDIIQQWRSALQASGYDIGALAYRAVRQQVLDGLRQQTQEQHDTIVAELARLARLRLASEPRNPDEIDQESRDSQIAHWREHRERLARRLEALDDLRTATIAWLR